MSDKITAQIFLSCGQADKKERDATARIKETLTAQGFEVYVAIQAQSIQDLNAGIIKQLERSDYYLFIDFRRERLGPDQESRFRGSLFTHQELALAYRSGFERVLFFRERGTMLEGLLRYMGANSMIFDSVDELVQRLDSSFRKRGWTPDYSRHLTATRLRWSDSVVWVGNSFSKFTGYFL
jgi:hypothetical protein